MEKMGKNDLSIDMYLQEQQCTMISPGYKYLKDSDGFSTFTKQERNPDNLIKLENTVSQRMQLGYQNALIETLEKKVPIVYIDCSQKGEDDIMFFILKEYIKQSRVSDKNMALAYSIGDNSIITESREERKNHVQKDKITTEHIILHYNQRLKELLQKGDAAYKKSLLDFESDITLDGIARLMRQDDQKYIYLYLDQIQILGEDEQQRINTLLYTRGAIKHDLWIRLKINNGKGLWKTRTSSSGHKIQATHDYSEINIYEKDLK